MEKLTAKQQRFCDEYLIDLNATQAALRAGYSAKTAYRTGADNLKKPQIQAFLGARMKEKESELIAGQDEVLRYLTGVMRGETQAARGVSSQLHPGDPRLQPVEKRVPVENRRAAQKRRHRVREAAEILQRPFRTLQLHTRQRRLIEILRGNIRVQLRELPVLDERVRPVQQPVTAGDIRAAECEIRRGARREVQQEQIFADLHAPTRLLGLPRLSCLNLNRAVLLT